MSTTNYNWSKDPTILRMREHAKSNEDTELITLCNRALDGNEFAIDECQQVLKNGCSLLQIPETP